MLLFISSWYSKTNNSKILKLSYKARYRNILIQIATTVLSNK